MKIVEITHSVAGMYWGDMLALAGARVTRIVPPLTPADAAGDEQQLAFEFLNAAKVTSEIDLSSEDKSALLDLVADADALIEDLGPARLETFGITEEMLRARQPKLVIGRMSEFGQTGPKAGWVASDFVNVASAGLQYIGGTWDRPPVALAPFQGQVVSGLYAVIGLLAALEGDEPVTLDISKQEAIASMVTPVTSDFVYKGIVAGREGKVATLTRIEMAKDKWVYAGPANPPTADYEVFGAFLGIPELGDGRFATPELRMENWEAHQALIQPRIRERTAQEWIDDAEAWRLTFGAVQDTLDLFVCPVLTEREFFRTVSTSKGDVRVPAAPYLVDNKRPQRPQP